MNEIIQRQFGFELRSVASEIDATLNIHDGSVAFIPRGIFTAVTSYSLFKDSDRLRKSASHNVSISLMSRYGETLDHHKSRRLHLTSYKKNPLVYYAGVACKRLGFKESRDSLADFLPKTVNLIGSIKGAINYTDRSIYHYGKNTKSPHDELIKALDMLNHFFHIATNDSPYDYFNHIYNKSGFHNFEKTTSESIERIIYGRLPHCPFFIAIASKDKFLAIRAKDKDSRLETFFEFKPSLLNCSITSHDSYSTYELNGIEFPACSDGIEVLQMFLGDNKLVDIDLKEVVEKISYDRKEQERIERL